jgi:glycosyltransferase involved in cell wall biosynthesis
MYEVIVVDNGSADATVSIAEEHGAQVVLSSADTVAGARNFGFDHSLGEVIIFLDADVQVSAAWGGHIGGWITSIAEEPMKITGSRCLPIDGKNLFTANWFGLIGEADTGAKNYVGTGHMIVSRKLFLEISGFNKSLITGEDFDFCSRAKKIGASIFLDTSLKVYHEGFPNTVPRFLKREAWHGMGDFQSLRGYFESRVALVTTIFIFAHASLIVSILLKKMLFSLSFFVLILLLPIFSSLIKFKGLPMRSRFYNCVIYYLYFVGRSYAPVRVIKRVFSVKRVETN